ncbi:MAG: hypothetical protein NC217_07590 [Muribaculaceae bacterium]|nr:hypothetical protein [Muribaculaceae bacterium]
MLTSLIKEIVTYKMSNETLPKMDDCLWFEDEKESLLYKLDVLREHFGNKFDINPYIYPNRLDDPIIDLDGIEEDLRENGIL